MWLLVVFIGMLVVSKGISVMIGIMVMFCVSSIVNVLCLFVVCISDFFDSVCNMIVVEDIDRIIFSVSVICYVWFSVMVISVSSVIVLRICILVSLISFLCMVYSVCGLSFSLIRNSIIMMLNLVKCCRLVILFLLFVSFSIGLIRMFEIR